METASDLAVIARYTGGQLRSLPENLRRLETDPPYDVRVSPALLRLREEMQKLHE